MLIGRPNGGVLIIYPDTFGAKAKFISTTSKRLCALSLHMSNIILHLFCVYMPCDINNDSNIDEYHSILSEISTLCMKQNAEHICIAGDMNTELTRQNSWHTTGIKRFVTDESFYFAHEHPTSNIEYSYFNTTYNTFSIIDHFIVTKHLYDSIVKHYSLCDEVDNQSDHCPIVLSLNIDVSQTIHSPTVHRSRKQWNRASESDKTIYRNVLDNCLK